jgi:hypothetical protein
MIRVEVVHSPAPRRVDSVTIELEDGARVGEAVARWLVLPRGAGSGLDAAAVGAQVGVWGRRVPLETVLRDGDRVEMYRPLQCDPKESRRRRQRLTTRGPKAG